MANNDNYYGADGGRAFHRLRATGRGRQFLNAMLDGLCLSREAVFGKDVADLGCGSGVVTEQLIRRGANRVFANDIQTSMIEAARKNLEQLTSAELDRLTLELGDIAELPVDDNWFDVIASVNVGCNTTNAVLRAHFLEMKRALRRGPNSKIVFTLPDNLDRVFTTGEMSEDEARVALRAAIAEVDAHSNESIRRALGSIPEVLYATFVARDGRLLLFEGDDVQLSAGDPIWRIVPGPLGIPNNYHTLAEYLALAEECGLTATALHQDCFAGDQERIRYNGENPELSLGETYLTHCFSVIEFSHK